MTVDFTYSRKPLCDSCTRKHTCATGIFQLSGKALGYVDSCSQYQEEENLTKSSTEKYIPLSQVESQCKTCEYTKTCFIYSFLDYRIPILNCTKYRRSTEKMIVNRNRALTNWRLAAPIDIALIPEHLEYYYRIRALKNKVFGRFRG
jgi:hypothetical protein